MTVLYVFMELKSNGGDKVKIITNFSNCNDRNNTGFKENNKITFGRSRVLPGKACLKPQENVTPNLPRRKIWVIYTITVFLEHIRQLRLQSKVN